MMKLTINQKQNPELFAQAAEKGHAIGLYVATMGWVNADMVIARSATKLIDSLASAIDLKLELRDAFIAAALKAVDVVAKEEEAFVNHFTPNKYGELA